MKYIVSLLTIVILSACGSEGNERIDPTNPIPVTSNLAPATVSAGGGEFTLIVNGSDFVAESVVRWDGADRITTYVSTTQLQADILGLDIATIGTATITVFNPTPGGGESNSITLAKTVPGIGNSVSFIGNIPDQLQEYGQQTIIPTDFGSGEFTFQVWVKLNNSYPVGSTDTSGGVNKANNWSETDYQPYSRNDWWFLGNFLIDGHNNNSSFTGGTFSLQIYGGGRVRWMFGDGGPELLAIQAWPATNTASLLDNTWHQITLVRRWSGTSALLELWVDDAQIATEISDRQTNMRDYWDTWSDFPSNQPGWFWAAEKNAIIGGYTYDDYKGLIDEARFWSRAMLSTEIISTYNQAVTGSEPGLVGLYHFDEGAGTTACNELVLSQCINMMLPAESWAIWDTENAPLQ